MLKHGKNEGELMQALVELDSLTATDSVLTHGQNVSVNCKVCHGKLENWTIEQDVNGGRFVKNIEYASGSGYSQLIEAIKETIGYEDVDEGIVILCYAEAKLSRDAEGRIVTRWIVVSPGVPFEMIDGMPEFPMLELKFTDSEYRIAMESRLALYNECTEDVYPIRNVAFSSIGKLLDSAASFKNMANIPLGSALLLAERFALNLKELKLICRNTKGHFKPLIGIAGNRFAEEPEYNFFRGALDKIANMFGFYTVADWRIVDDLSRANVYVSSNDGSQKALNSPERYNQFALYNDFPVYLRIQTSDIPGISASVSAFAKIGRGHVMIQKNSAYHWNSFLKRGGSASLFYRTDESGNEITLKDDIDGFVELYHRLKSCKVEITKEVEKAVKDIVFLIGKRRFAEKEDEMKKLYQEDQISGYEFFERAIDITFHQLPEKQYNELSVLYYKLAKAIAN